MVAPHPMASFVAHFMAHTDERVARRLKAGKTSTTLPVAAAQREPIPEPPALVRTLQPVIPALPRQIDLERARRIRA